MRTVFIANKDEERIKRLSSLVEWSKFDYELIGHATDGVNAMSEILREKPVLVFISNDLPGISGINVIEKIRSHGLMCEFVLLEDTEDFKLAQKAMRLGVREYLLNPVTLKDVTRILTDVLERYQASHSKDTESYLFQTRRLLRNSFMRNFVSSENRRISPISELNAQYHFSFNDGFFQGVLIQLRNLPKEEEETFLPAVTEELRFRFDPICYEMIPFIQGALRLTLLLNYDETSPMPKRLNEIHDIIKEFLSSRGCHGTSYSIGIGSQSRDANSLLNTLHSAERAAYCEILQGSNKIFYIDQQEFDNLKVQDVVTADFQNELRMSVESMDIVKYENIIRRAFDRLNATTDPEIIVEICRAAIIEIAKASEDPEALSREQIRRVLYAAINAPSLSAILSNLMKNARTKLEALQKEREFSKPIREATKFIKENFRENLTLANVADHVHLNASYLSMLFKKETDKNYMSFLTDCRIEEAKKLLKDSNMSVAEICYAVGYTDKKHFSRLFIKHIGIRPTAYRSLH